MTAKPKTAPKAPRKAPPGPAAFVYQRLIAHIQNFEKQLDSTHEVAMGFAGGEAGVLRIESVGFHDPDILSFFGRDEDGFKTQLIQHVSQLSVVLRAVPKDEPEAPPRRIGFAFSPGWIGGESGDGSV